MNPRKSFTINFYNRKKKQLLWNYLRTLKGTYHVIIDPSSPYEYKTRYKYFFGHIVPVIEEACIFVNEDGEPLDSKNVFYELKRMFAPSIIRNSITNQVTVSARSTSQMPDGEFIAEFEDVIFMTFSQHPFNLDFIDRHEWIKKRKAYHEGLKE